MNKRLPILILALAAALTATFVLLRPTTREVTPLRPVPMVEVIEVQAQSIQLTVRSQGTVLPCTETELSVEVSGRILERSKNFRAGGYIEVDEVLLRIDPADYAAAVAVRTAELANAYLVLAQQEALAEQALADWTAMGVGQASELALRKPQLVQARARIDSAEALLKQAQRDLDRTQVRAPYSGRVLSTSVDLGQYVSAAPAASIARIYATDCAEIRLPITEREAELLDLTGTNPSEVRITRLNRAHGDVWQARLARLEATVDPVSRLLYAVAEVQDPFQAPAALRRGQFVAAEIFGQKIERAYLIPRYALRGSHSVYVVGPDSTLQTRSVEIIQSDPQQAVIGAGLTPGARVVISPIAYFIENMPVQIIDSQ